MDPGGLAPAQHHMSAMARTAAEVPDEDFGLLDRYPFFPGQPSQHTLALPFAGQAR